MRNLNRHALVDLVRFTDGGISRVEIARQLQLTRAAVTEIVNELIDLQIIQEAQGQRPGSQRPIALKINPDLGLVLGVDIGATHVTLALADFSAHIVQEIDIQVDIEDGPKTVLARVDGSVKELLNAAGIDLQDIQSVGVGVPGPIVAQAGWVSNPSLMPGWDRYPLREHFLQTFHCPVALNNDANLGALGEWAYGAGRGERNLVYLKVGTGIGAGLLLDGQIYGGISGSAGEIGHITIDGDGPVCACGNRGCLEGMVGGNAIANRAIELVVSGKRTQLSRIEPREKITAGDVIFAARQGDLIAQQILIEAGQHLGTAVASIVNLFNPGMVIVGGMASQMGDLFLEPVRQAVQKRSLRAASRNVRITAALLGARSSAVGAVVAALSNVLHPMIDKE